jgi:hypothetical protein
LGVLARAPCAGRFLSPIVHSRYPILQPFMA